MIPYLENIPHDILQYIAFLGASSSIFELPNDLSQLLLTSSTIYQTLSVRACPHLYAKLFRTKFDLAAIRRRFSAGLTNSCLAAEFVQRCRALRRIRRHEMSGPDLRQDLWTILWMILESDGLNEAQLFAVGFSRFILALIRNSLHEDRVDSARTSSETNSLALWLFSLTLSRQEVSSKTIETRDEILMLLRPFTVSILRHSVAGSPALISHLSSTRPICRSRRSLCLKAIIGPSNGQADTHNDVVHYSRQYTPVYPEPSSAVIVLTFALKEATSLEIPSHLPENRAIATANQRFGPTMEDYRTVACCRTPLFADTRPEIFSSSEPVATVDPSRSLKQDQEYIRILRAPDYHGSAVHFYKPGTLTGLWEGTFMISPFIPPVSNPSQPLTFCVPDFLCQQPMQCCMSEHFCFSPHVPLPMEDVEGGNVSLDWNLSPSCLVESQDGFEIASRKFRYQKFNTPSKSRADGWRDPNHALDMVITGQTLQEHDDAWGGFKFIGKVARDGTIVLKREPKNNGEIGLGTWIFEGRLHFGSAFVGTWRSRASSDCCGIRGIFSMRKRLAT